MKRGILLCVGGILTGLLLVAGCSDRQAGEPTGILSPPNAAPAATQQSDPALVAALLNINRQLAARGLRYAAESIEFFTIGNGRPEARLHQEPFRWVPNDPRRNADGDNITYMVDQPQGTTASGLTNAQTEAAIDQALATWTGDKSLNNVQLVKRPYTGVDPDIYDSFFGFGSFGTPFQADIIEAGWYPRGLFEAAGGAGGGGSILAFTISFIFVDNNGNPTDINGDNYLDQAFSEVYYNNTWGDPNGDRANYPWGIGIALPGIDVQTVALHENGHAIDLGHFGPPPVAVMNPVYAGIRLSPYPADNAGLSTVWASWPLQ